MWYVKPALIIAINIYACVRFNNIYINRSNPRKLYQTGDDRSDHSEREGTQLWVGFDSWMPQRGDSITCLDCWGFEMQIRLCTSLRFFLKFCRAFVRQLERFLREISYPFFIILFFIYRGMEWWVNMARIHT